MSAATELTVKLPLTVSDSEARLPMAVRLFETGKVFLGQAASVAGLSGRAFMDILGREDIAMVNYPTTELRKEWGE